MKLKDLKALSLAELEQELIQLRNTLFHGRMQAATKQLKKVSDIRKARIAIAQVLTLLSPKRALMSESENKPAAHS